jgi:hypothetical protein
MTFLIIEGLDLHPTPRFLQARTGLLRRSDRDLVKSLSVSGLGPEFWTVVLGLQS